MALYHFHSTNGAELVPDPLGFSAADLQAVERRARLIRRKLKARMAENRDWSDWRVVVVDASGRQVLTVPFQNGSGRRR
jgi:hypothetical protein